MVRFIAIESDSVKILVKKKHFHPNFDIQGDLLRIRSGSILKNPHVIALNKNLLQKFTKIL